VTAGRAAGRIALALLACAAVAVSAARAEAFPADAPRTNYMIQCQGCHLADGSGRPGAVPSLVDGLGRFLATPAGRAFLVRVPGSATSPLDDAALAAVLNWMIRRFDPAAAERFPPYTAAEVGRVRHPPLDDVQRARRGLLGGAPDPARGAGPGGDPRDAPQERGAPSR